MPEQPAAAEVPGEPAGGAPGEGSAGPAAGSPAGGAAGPGALAARLGHPFADAELLHQALAHRSWCAESGGAASNERLEYLGDAVLGLAVAEHCYGAYPDLPEGALAKIRAAVVNTAVLAEVAVELGVGDHLLLGRGEDASGGRHKPSILANAMEALIGATYLDGGWEAAAGLVLRLLGSRIADAAAVPGADDFKTRLQELVVRSAGQLPRYEVSGSGPDHARHYTAVVLVAGAPCGTGEGRSKKDAEQAAARQAWRGLAGAAAAPGAAVPEPGTEAATPAAAEAEAATGAPGAAVPEPATGAPAAAEAEAATGEGGDA